MGKRPVESVDLTGTGVIIDLTSDSNECVGDTEHLRPVKSNIVIPWLSKLCGARRLSVRDNINASEFREDASWFGELRRDASFVVEFPEQIIKCLTRCRGGRTRCRGL